MGICSLDFVVGLSLNSHGLLFGNFLDWSRHDEHHSHCLFLLAFSEQQKDGNLNLGRDLRKIGKGNLPLFFAKRLPIESISDCMGRN